MSCFNNKPSLLMTCVSHLKNSTFPFVGLHILRSCCFSVMGKLCSLLNINIIIFFRKISSNDGLDITGIGQPWPFFDWSNNICLWKNRILIHQNDLTVNDSNCFSSIMIYSMRELKEEKIWLLSLTFSQFFVVSAANFWWKLLSVNLGKMKCNNY